MSELSQEQIVAALEEVRVGNEDPTSVSALENFLIDLLLAAGKEAVGALLLNLEGMNFLLLDAPQGEPNLVFRSDHKENALIVEVFAMDDLASISISAEDAEVPQLPAGHRWFYEVWENLIGEEVEEPLALSDPGRTVYLIASFEAQVMNGGLGQYLSNTDGAFLEETVDALKKVGAKRTASYLREAASLKLADETWDELWERAGSQLGKLDDNLMADDEYLAMKTASLFGEDS